VLDACFVRISHAGYCCATRQKDKQDKIRQNEKTVLSCKIALFDFVSH
jgi:hypothetical protein